MWGFSAQCIAIFGLENTIDPNQNRDTSLDTSQVTVAFPTMGCTGCYVSLYVVNRAFWTHSGLPPAIPWRM